MAYPTDKPSGNYSLRESNFAELDNNKIPMDNNLWKNGYKNAEESEIESVPDAHEQNWLFDVLHRNLRYTQETAEENKRLLENKVASYTTIGQIKVGSGLTITSNGVLSVVRSVAEDANVISYDLPVGSYMLWAGNTIPDYFIEPDGTPLKRSEFPDLWKFAQDNDLIGKLFDEGDGVSTFTPIDIRGHFISIANSNENIGKFTNAGLPNITGGFSLRGTEYAGDLQEGAFYQKGQGGSRGTGHEHGGVNPLMYFDASRSNAIYGKSSTVTPANWSLKLIMKAKPTPPSKVVPIGTILDYTTDDESKCPIGYIVANGGELLRSEYQELFNWASTNKLIKDQSEIPTTAHGFYGSGDGVTTFTIPDLRGVFRRSADLASDRGGTELGHYQADGLPNITGQFQGGGQMGATFGKGAFARVRGGHAISNQGEADDVYGFNAENGRKYWHQEKYKETPANTIYGNSKYVQPKSVSILPILKY